MKAIRSMKLATKLPLAITAFCLLVTTIQAVVAFTNARAKSVEQAEEHFSSTILDRRQSIQNWLEVIDSDVITLAASPTTRTAFQRLNSAWNTLENPMAYLQRVYINENPFPSDQRAMFDKGEETGLYNTHHGIYHDFFRKFQNSKGFHDIFLFNAEGDLIYSVQKERDFATNFRNGAYAESGLSKAFRRAMEGSAGQVYVADLSYYAANDRMSLFVSSPIVDETGRKIGAVGLELPLERLTRIIANERGLGKSGEIYVVSSNMRLATEPRLKDGPKLMDVVPALPQVEAALDGEERFYENVSGLQGRPVIAYASGLHYHNAKWALVAEQDMAEIYAPARQTGMVLVAFAAVSAVLLSILGWLFARTITVPLAHTTEAMLDISNGNLDIDVPDTDRKDEIGDMASSLSELKDKLVEARTANEERAEMQRQLQNVVESLTVGLTCLAKGDLTRPIAEPFPAAYESLRLNFNKTLSTLNSAMSDVVAAAESINRGSVEISQASDDLSNRTENQAATLEETAAALDELTSAVKSAADGTKSVAETVGQARSEAEQTGQTMQSAVSAMTEIEKSSEHISQIIGVIDDIAFQTNLLALNAGVEAARAGDAGKGFAVVASEVRALAQRSSEAAKEIKTLISSSTQQVKNGVELVGLGGKALDGIVERVQHISTLTTEIAASAEELANGIGEINTGVTQLDQVTQKNAAMVEQTTAASHLLNKDAAQLSDLVSRFVTSQSEADLAGDLPPAVRQGEEIADGTQTSRTINGGAHPGVWQDF
ncbi:methyl-accepting chemotaxis protein [Rhodovulum imhoffii]|uniref:Methyl-accepting chemotaxis protein n=1 Tax=Rhodovulum imhoffii TaxID=365340 RepID=A0A2T5BRJ2_9RHOB|nr:methyl-accepting chemotaxis protein [Rhodovulum imhoffii]PTN01881.1 methyl-accepting chemotaxis protein [Rhodovulum imhoffii]